MSCMDGNPYSVSVVLDSEFGPRLRELLKEGPIWVVANATNRAAAELLWAEFPGRNHLDRVTIFDALAGRSPAQMLIAQMGAIDLHHGAHSADPAYTVIRVLGCELDPLVQECLSDFGFNSFQRTAEGFEAVRPLPPPSGG